MSNHFEIKQQSKPVKRTKLKELALYYNLAIDRVVMLLNYYQSEPNQEDDFWKQKLRDWKRNENVNVTIKLSTFAYLKNFLFNTSTQDRSEKIVIGTDEKRLLITILEKLFELRNWHSHYCHNDKVLYFNSPNIDENKVLIELKEFLTSHLMVAAEKCIKNDEEHLQYYNEQLDKAFRLFDEDKITQEGRIFFLHFFLTKSEMIHCLSGISGFKRSKSYWNLKREIFSFYSKRDGTSILAILYKTFERKEGASANEVRRQMSFYNRYNQIVEYLKKKPANICTDSEIEHWKSDNENYVSSELPAIRLKNSFMNFAIQYLIDFEDDLRLKNKIEWRFRDSFFQQEKKSKNDTVINFVKSKPVFGSSSFVGERIYIKNGMAYFKFNSNQQRFLCCINEQALMYWIAALILDLKKPEAILKDIYGYIIQYKTIVNQLKEHKQVDLSKFDKIVPELLHTKLRLWVSGANGEDVIPFYKNKILKKVESGLKSFNLINRQQLLKLKPSEKNRLLLKWYNYLLPADSKLSHTKNLNGRFSEIDNISRFHFMPLSFEGNLRANLLKDFRYKLPQYLIEALLDRGHKNIDDIILEIIPIIKRRFEFWKKIIELGIHPPEWENTNKTPSELENASRDQWSTMQIENWHILARKLEIRNPFLDNMRGGGKETNRMNELYTFFENQPVQLPKYLFVDHGMITSISEHKNPINQVHKSLSKQIRQHSLSNALIAEYYDIEKQIEPLKLIIKTRSGYSLGGAIKEILYTKTTDTLIWGISIRYHQKLYAWGLQSENSRLDYSNISLDAIEETVFNWSIAGSNVLIKKGQLKKLMYTYPIEEVEMIVKRKLNKENTAESLISVFVDNYFSSLKFIQRVLELEECVLRRCDERYGRGSLFVDFKAVLQKVSLLTNEEKDLLLLLRKAAMHTHIPENGHYEDGIEIIERVLNKQNFKYRQFERSANVFQE
jgi:hypothetical protein